MGIIAKLGGISITTGVQRYFNRDCLENGELHAAMKNVTRQVYVRCFQRHTIHSSSANVVVVEIIALEKRLFTPMQYLRVSWVLRHVEV